MGDFANVFKKLRVSAGYTQEELSKKLGISRSRIGMYETGSREPDFETLETIADFFNVDIDYLMGRESSSMYYLNPDTAKAAQEIFDNRELRVLFDAARNAKPEDLETVTDVLRALLAKENGRNGDDGA